MKYEKMLIDQDGEEYPYSESIDENEYHYRISIVFEEKDGELHVMNSGCHIQFDDGTWLVFNIDPERLFVDQDKLSEADLLRLMHFLEHDKVRRLSVLYSKEEIEKFYAKYKEHLKSEQDIEQDN